MAINIGPPRTRTRRPGNARGERKPPRQLGYEPPAVPRNRAERRWQADRPRPLPSGQLRRPTRSSAWAEPLTAGGRCAGLIDGAQRVMDRPSSFTRPFTRRHIRRT